MKTTLKKLTALLAAAALVLSLAACGGTGDEADSTGGSTEPNTNETLAPANGESTQADESATDTGNSETGVSGSSAETTNSANTAGTTKPANNAQTPGGNTAKAPSGVNEIVNYYNAAVKKISKVSTSYTRKITSGSVSVVNLTLTEQKYADVINRNNVKLSGNDASLKALSTSDVSSAACTENGNNYTLTISLKTKTGADNAIKSGAGGYLYFAELAEISSTVGDVGKVLGVSGITVETAKITLSNGKLTVTADKASGKISKAVLTFTESVDATAKYMFIKPAAKLNVNFTVNYTAS